MPRTMVKGLRFIQELFVCNAKAFQRSQLDKSLLFDLFKLSAIIFELIKFCAIYWANTE